jgi:arsenate reductase
MGNSVEVRKIKVLFVCTGNSARSQIAEAILRTYGHDKFEAYSAGLEPRELHPLAINVMNEIGVDMSNHYAKPLSRYIGRESFDYVITVCDNAEKRCPVFPGKSRRLHWALDDPSSFAGNDQEKLAKFREVRDRLIGTIEEWMIGLNG